MTNANTCFLRATNPLIIFQPLASHCETGIMKYLALAPADAAGHSANASAEDAGAN